MANVTIIDYGVGNLLSVRRALEQVGADVQISSDPVAIAGASHVVLPGVGAFADGMDALRERGLDKVVLEVAAAGTPLLGICLGMQMLADSSDEFGASSGLGLIPGRVESIPNTAASGESHKIPYIGWGEIHPTSRWDGSPLNGTSVGAAVYLVHSYRLIPEDPAHQLAAYDYGGHAITAAVGRANVFGCQFHPEKSGRAGLRILAEFLNIKNSPADH